MSFLFSNLAAGDYTLILGGNGGGGHGRYAVTFAAAEVAAPVPLPGAVWLFGSVLATGAAVGKRERT
ncbi:hypothetical protein [Methylomonas koyamae]|uniref:hypothetical protein n=1 Tax=Methylomonas koyamae TaxID=702114 RepID=UPI000BDF1779|nr:hypothetical protein [Methylomonas koyamae]